MISAQHILCFGPGDWWHMNPSCTRHIMRRLADRNTVLYVNPFSADLPGRGASRRGLAQRVGRKLRSLARCLRRADQRLYTFTPFFIPAQGNPRIDRLNNALIRAQLRGVCRMLGVRPSLLWLENPRAADALDWYPGLPSVYHVSDAFTHCPYTRDRAALERREARLTRDADLLICVSQALHDAKTAARNGCVHYLPHGVDFERFRAAARRAEPAPELRGLPRPIAGYFGTLTAENDIELLEYCARNAPEIGFAFAGRVTAGDYSALRRMPNVRFCGQVPYERIPDLAAAFDVGLLPWRMTEWIQYCNPLKLLEYLAAGLPVVSVPIPQVAQLAGDLVSFASDPPAFLEAIRREAQDHDAERAARRVELARRHSWSAHAERLSELVRPLLAAPKP